LAGFHMSGNYTLVAKAQASLIHCCRRIEAIIKKLSNLKLCRLLTEMEGGGPLGAALLTLELSFRRKQTNT